MPVAHHPRRTSENVPQTCRLKTLTGQVDLHLTTSRILENDGGWQVIQVKTSDMPSSGTDVKRCHAMS